MQDRYSATGRAFGLVALLALSTTSFPQAGGTGSDERHVADEYLERIEAARTISPLEDGLFGDHINPFTGSLEFSVLDASLPGNNALPVEVRRRLDVSATAGRPRKARTTGWFGDWDLDIPHMHGVFLNTAASGSPAGGWITQTTGVRCNQPLTSLAPPPESGAFASEDYWQGSFLHVPGSGDQELLHVDASVAHRPSDGGTYRWATKEGWVFSCVNGTNNGHTGDSFVARSPDGVRYWFNHYTERTAGMLRLGSDAIGRAEIAIWPTRVEDRFGNWVEYRYNPDNEKQLTRIVASDGRVLDLSYTGLGLVATRIAAVTDGHRTWRYTYSGDTYASRLTTVTQPDGAQWTMTNPFLSDAATQALGACASAGWLNGGDFPLTMTHPSGATATFITRMVAHGRTYVPRNCVSVMNDQGQVYDSFDKVPVVFAAPTVVRKVISGPGMDAKTWTWTWPALVRAYADQCAAGCATSKSVDMKLPDGSRVRNTFGVRYGVNEGALLKSEHFPANAATPIASTDFDYQTDAAGQAYSAEVARRYHPFGDPASATYRPLRKRVHAQQGATFTWEVTSDAAGRRAFDAFGNPTQVRKSSSLGYARTDSLAYHYDTTRWVLGQPASSTNVDTGLVESRTEYDSSTALPVRRHAFGKLQQILTHHADGTVASVADGKGNVTRFTSYKRGLPQRTTFADGSFQSVSVNDQGLVQWSEDEIGHRACYTYDPMGRVTKVTYPSDTVLHTCDESQWNPLQRALAPVAAAEYGIGAGHWKESVNTGTGFQVTYFDGLWRPVVVERYDNTNATTRAATLTQAVTRYAPQGGVAFQSYPVNKGAAINVSDATVKGTRTTYDALGRPTRIEQDGEYASPLVTTHEYRAGFETLVSNPRGASTLTRYLAYDQPTTEMPVTIAQPEGAITNIARDPFGKVLSIVRRNQDSSVALMRSYAYNAAQLCRTSEPETGVTLMGYDAAGNLAWSAAGLPAGTACEANGTNAAVLLRKSERAYDSRNRLVSLKFADGIGEQTWEYTPDSLPASVWTYNGPNRAIGVNNAYVYNSRRMLGGAGESVHQANWYTWGVGYGYDRNGFVVTRHNPDNSGVTYQLNGLGQIQGITGTSGTYVSNASYFPNGALKQFTYGNGIVHTLTQNARGLPERSRDAYGPTAVLDDSYDYDPNGNVLAISDGLPGARGNRTMTYDGLDRLRSVASPMYSGTVAYTYDVLDNLQTLTAPGQNLRYCYGATNRLAFIRSNAADCSSGAATSTFEFDEQGNLKTRNSQAYVFGQNNRLREVTGKEGYRYDALGHRVLSNSALGNLFSMYSQDGVLVHQTNARVGKAYSHIYLAGSLVATREVVSATGVVTMRYSHTDALGSPVAVTDANRNVIERTEYGPYGKVLNRGLNDRPGYTGHVEDAQTGLSYMQQRYYDPVTGRFLSVDPIAANANTGGGFNRYVYAAINPYRFTDPDGRCAKIKGSSICQDSLTGTVTRFMLQAQGKTDMGKTQTAWPVPGHTRLNAADRPREGRGEFGSPRNTPRGRSTHTGIDIEAPKGARVVSPQDGVVVDIRPNPSGTYGNQVVISHGNGVFSQSAHLDTVAVKPGALVNGGQDIGTVGRSGNTPPLGDSHLHFEIRLNSSAPRSGGGTVADPLKYLPQP